MDTEKQQSPAKAEREKLLALERQKILSMTPEQALDTIAEHPYPVTLVQSFAEEDLYLLVHSIGLDDSLPILALASNDQWEYLLDMEVWEGDRVDMHTMTGWLDRLRKADPDRFTHWITHEKLEEFEFYLFHNVELRIREHDQEASDFQDGFSTEDGVFYTRLRRYPSANEDEKKFLEERDLFLTDLLKRISVYDHINYRNVLLEAGSLIPAEAEEEHYRLRNIRLAEKGFLPFDEAVGVYQPLSVAELLKRGRKDQSLSGRLVDTYPIPLEPADHAQNANLFARTLARIQDPLTLQRLQAEFAGLCNQVIAADQRRVRDKSILSQVVQKTGDYISIGLEKVSAEQSTADPYRHANLVQHYLLADIFRVGYGCALHLKWQAERFHRESWFLSAGLSLSFWGEYWMGILGGLLLKKPLFFDNYSSGVLYREFATLEDIRQTEHQLNTIIGFDNLLSLMDIDTAPAQAYGLLTYQNLLLTLWADHYVGMPGPPKTPVPLPIAEFRRFFKEIWQEDKKPRKISNATKELFLDWLAERSDFTPAEISERMGSALERLFSKIENELGQVDPKHLDPRHIYLFMVSKK